MIGFAFAAAVAIQTAKPNPMPVRGLHLGAPDPEGLASCEQFIREDLPSMGVNTLVMEFDYGFKSMTHPEVGKGPLSTAQIHEIAETCKGAHIRLIPQINLLGHQSWSSHTDALLAAHPEFDETPHKFPGNKGKMPDGENFYCRSYCPQAPGLHEVIFALMDELADACEADAFHCGMDEVWVLCDKDCPRCGGKPTSEVFANEVKALHDHLAAKHREMWMWGDRFLDGRANGLGKWEASENGTAPAIDMVPKDIVICDWHYDYAEPTAAYFALHGFRVVSCPWRKSSVALGELDEIRQIRQDANPNIADKAYGVMHTTWCGEAPFVDRFHGRASGSRQVTETVQCFRDLAKAWASN